MLKVIKNSSLVPVPIVNLTLEDSANPESTDPITARGAAQGVSDAIKNIIDDEDTGSIEYIISGDADVAAEYDVGKFYRYEDKIAKCTDKTSADDVYTMKFEVINGITAALNDLVDRIEALSE